MADALGKTLAWFALAFSILRAKENAAGKVRAIFDAAVAELDNAPAC
jgi:hypothetical protein